MDKQQYKDMIAEQFTEIADLKDKIEELESKLKEKEKDYYFNIRNKEMELVVLQKRLEEYEQT